MDGSADNNIKYSIDGKVFVIEIHRPEKKNALLPEMYAALAAGLREDREHLRGVRADVVRVARESLGADFLLALGNLRRAAQDPPRQRAVARARELGRLLRLDLQQVLHDAQRVVHCGGVLGGTTAPIDSVSGPLPRDYSSVVADMTVRG